MDGMTSLPETFLPETLHVESRIVHPSVPDVTGSRPLGVPIHQNHLFAFDDADALAEAFSTPGGAFFYGRLGNPTVRALEIGRAHV